MDQPQDSPGLVLFLKENWIYIVAPLVILLLLLGGIILFVDDSSSSFIYNIF